MRGRALGVTRGMSLTLDADLVETARRPLRTIAPAHVVVRIARGAHVGARCGMAGRGPADVAHVHSIGRVVTLCTRFSFDR